ncbi:unannotated protein [freshwater metagenome]|uniref:Unannotated protein n=1 Tax=freshwater metagenome TaxID=449393 RepID=A0A6J7PIV5_9ZZZZ
MHERRSQIEPALHATGVGADRSIERVGQIDQLAELGDPRRHRLFGQAVQPTLEAQQFATCLLRVEGRFL